MPQTRVVGGPGAPGNPAPVDIPLVIDPSFGAARTSVRPYDHNASGLYGHYRLAAPTGLVTGAAAAAILFSLQWAPKAQSLLVLQKLSVGAIITTAYTAAQAVDVDAVIVRGFTAADTGGTTLALGASNKVRTNMGNSLVAAANIATTAGLSAGTGTADGNAFAINAISQTNAVGSGGMALADLYNVQDQGQHPVVLAPNEGFRVRIVTAQGSTGVVKYYVMAEWAELAGF